MIFAVSGPPGSGKTHWIKECLAKSEGQPSRYFSAQTESIEYDYQKTCAAIIEKGLPAIFAWRLARGDRICRKGRSSYPRLHSLISRFIAFVESVKYILAPPKSPLKRGTLTALAPPLKRGALTALAPPLKRGAGGDRSGCTSWIQ